MRPSFVALIAILAAAPGAAGQQVLAPDSTVRALLQERLPAAKGGGIVVGLLDPDGRRRVVAVGVTPDRVFEIGSITKVFTASILARMVADGSVRLDDPVAKYLPPSVRVPARDGRQITLLDLATQSSGLPHLYLAPLCFTSRVVASVMLRPAAWCCFRLCPRCSPLFTLRDAASRLHRPCRPESPSRRRASTTPAAPPC